MQMISNRKFSLWLMPEEKPMAELQVEQARNIEQARIIAMHPDENLPAFDPHITLIGGVPISDCCKLEEIESRNDPGVDIDREAARVVLQRLQDEFTGFGSVTCEFLEEEGVCAYYEADGTAKWNQASLSIVKETDNFMDAMRRADRALFRREDLDVRRHFRKPASAPHYSFIYTTNAEIAEGLRRTLQCPDPFKSTTIAMWWTDPPDINAVANRNQWGHINNIALG